MINWQYFPKSESPSKTLLDVINIFSENENDIGSDKNAHSSDQVLKRLSPHLEKIGFIVETGKKKDQKISLPVSFGKNGRIEKSFDVDGFKKDEGIILEIEAGRGVTNYQFLKDFFKALVIKNADYIIIAVRKIYRKKKDFDDAVNFINSAYLSSRLNLPIKGTLIIGY